ncbi:MAG: DoxX family protein [Terracidiphilus sp.]
MASTSSAINAVKPATQGTAAPQIFAEETKASKALVAAFWIVTAIFCLEMSFTAYYELLPQGAQAFARLGFSAHYFPIEPSLAKLVGVAALLVPMVPARLKEWAYAGFAINLVSAIIAHLSIHDIPQALAPSSITSVLWALSYYLWRRRQAAQASA